MGVLDDGVGPRGHLGPGRLQTRHFCPICGKPAACWAPRSRGVHCPFKPDHSPTTYALLPRFADEETEAQEAAPASK